MSQTLRYSKTELVQIVLPTYKPTNPDVIHEWSYFLANVGRLKQSLILRQKLLTIEPLVPIFTKTTAELLWVDGQNEAALELAGSLPPTNRDRGSLLAKIYAALGRYTEAAEALSRALPDPATPTRMIDDAMRLLKEAPLKVPPKDLPTLKVRFYFVYLHVGAPERAPLWVDAPIGVRYFWLHRDYAPIRKSPAFKAAVRKYGFVDYWRARGWPDMCRPVGADDFECD